MESTMWKTICRSCSERETVWFSEHDLQMLVYKTSMWKFTQQGLGKYLAKIFILFVHFPKMQQIFPNMDPTIYPIALQDVVALYGYEAEIARTRVQTKHNKMFGISKYYHHCVIIITINRRKVT